MKKRTTKKPFGLTSKEKGLLNKCIRVDDWHFENFFNNRCSQIDDSFIGWDKEDKQVRVYTYGLKAIISDTKQSAIANFFVRYQYRMYQAWDIERVVELKNLIKKEFILEQYKNKISNERIDKPKKLRKVA